MKDADKLIVLHNCEINSIIQKMIDLSSSLSTKTFEFPFSVDPKSSLYSNSIEQIISDANKLNHLNEELKRLTTEIA